jgi:hypothetical protein
MAVVDSPYGAGRSESADSAGHYGFLRMDSGYNRRGAGRVGHFTTVYG